MERIKPLTMHGARLEFRVVVKPELQSAISEG
jgi:hypothetical protein